MVIRTETEKDFGAVEQLHYKAFGERMDESKMVEKVRASEGFIPELSLVAEEAGTVIGHLLLSKAKVVEESGQHEVIVLAPIGVEPGRQKQGVGKALIEEGLARCRNLGYELVFLIGHPSYYPKFGFKPARPFGLELKQFDVPDDVFMVCEIREGALQGTKGELRYTDAFF